MAIIFLARTVVFLVLVAVELRLDMAGINQLKGIGDQSGVIAKSAHERSFRDKHFIWGCKVLFSQFADQRILTNGPK